MVGDHYNSNNIATETLDRKVLRRGHVTYNYHTVAWFLFYLFPGPLSGSEHALGVLHGWASSTGMSIDVCARSLVGTSHSVSLLSLSVS